MKRGREEDDVGGEPVGEDRKRKVKKEELNLQEKKFKNLDFLVGKFACSLCGKDMTTSIRIVCAECANTQLCLECLLSHRESLNNGHLAVHDYYILDRLSHSLYSEDWNLLEEMQLLYGLEKFGMDNFIDISESIGTKTPQQCQDHYYTFYYKSREDKFPDNSEILTQRDQITGEIQKLELNYEKSRARRLKISQTLQNNATTMEKYEGLLEEEIEIEEKPGSKGKIMNI